MCGIVGFWDNKLDIDLRDTAKRMCDAIIHRGPDDEGLWIDRNSGVALGHRRLSIIDLSPAGHQPMISKSERYVITYNGEIYNFQEIRKELEISCQLEGVSLKLRGSSDTEIILCAIERFGIKKAIEKFIGMYAFAVFDRQEKVLYLVRDRLGEKPLYYGRVNNCFVFASELKALKRFPGFANTINRGALTQFFRYSYIPAPQTIYSDIYKLEPGSILTIQNEGMIIGEPEPYWSAFDAAQKGMENPVNSSEEEAYEELERILRRSISGQMISDVPLGAFLSGGVDSSLVVALMQTQSSIPVKTFTIGFYEDDYNEAREAKKVAMHLGTDHTEMYVTSEEAMSVIPKLPALYDEPFSDSSQIPTFLVSGIAKKNVTVSLSGDGGDELFGGYNRYFLTQGIWKKFNWMPLGMRRVTAKAVKSVSPQSWDRIYKGISAPLPQKYRFRMFGDKLHKLANIIDNNDATAIYYDLISHWRPKDNLVVGADAVSYNLSKNGYSKYFRNVQEMMMFLDLVTYLPDDILVKVDRAAMGVSLETRVPLLDYRVVEYAWRLPMSYKIKDNKGKWPLRHILYKYVPKELIERPKMGFGIPIGDWLRGPLKGWAEDLLNETRIKQEGLLNYKIVRQKWEQHINGSLNWQYYLWDVLVFEAWLENESKGLM